MDTPVSLETMEQILIQNKEPYTIMELDHGFSLLVLHRSGRVFGPFAGGDSPGLSWMPQAAATPDLWRRFRAEANWNIGGDRVWIAPEFPFFTKERRRFHETYVVQPSIDPGDYAVSRDGLGGVTLEARPWAQLFEHRYPRKEFYLKRTLRKNANPLKASSSFARYMDGVSFCGYEQDIRLEDLSPDRPMPLEIWELMQVRPGGVFLIPYLGDRFEYVDYYAPSAGKVLDIRQGYAQIRVESSAEHKIGAKAFQTFGRAGYLKQLGGGEWMLLVRNYYNDPSSGYIKEPSGRPGETGCSLFVYINDTRGDGHAELETTGRTFQAPGKPDSTLVLNYWYFTGGKDPLKAIARALLGIAL